MGDIGNLHFERRLPRNDLEAGLTGKPLPPAGMGGLAGIEVVRDELRSKRTLPGIFRLWTFHGLRKPFQVFIGGQVVRF